MDTKSTLNKNQFANDNLLGNGQLVFSGFMPIQKWTPVILCVLFVFVVLLYLIGVFVAFFLFWGEGKNNMQLSGEGGEEDVKGVGSGKSIWPNYIV